MTRMEFLKQLEYLLQDIDEKDREDALNYYMDYMDDANLGDTDTVDGLLDTPERIAISVRSSVNNETEDQTEFSEQGFKNIRFEPEQKVPQVYNQGRETEADPKADDGWQKTESRDCESGSREYSDDRAERGNRLGRILLIAVLAIVALPVVFGVGGTVISVLVGFFLCIFGVLLAAAGGGIALTVGGFVLFVLSIIRMTTYVWEGVMMMGVSFVMLALGILGIMLTVILCKRFIPWAVRGIVNLFHRLFQRGGEAS